MSSPPRKRQPQVPPEIAFVSLPNALAQFHHLPAHVPVWEHRQEETRTKGYDFTEGARVMEVLLEKSPEIPGAYLYQLFVRKWPKLREVAPYFNAGRVAEAIPKLVEVLEIDPECPLTCFQLGYCFRATGELEKSESFYLKALRMAPDAGWIYSNLGRTYQAMDKKSKAAESFWKALELLPGDSFVLEQLVELGELFPISPEPQKGESQVLYIRRADYEKKMREIFEKTVEPSQLVSFGWGLLRNRLPDLARQSFEKARKLGKDFSEALLGLGCADLEEGRLREAEQCLMEYLEEKPDSVPAHLALFKVYLAREETDLAWDEIQTALRLDPHRTESLKQLYYLFFQTNRKEEGLETLDQMAKANPSSAAPLLVKAWALTEDGQWLQARQTLDEALQRSPGDEEILLFLTSQLGRRGQREEIIQVLSTQAFPLPLSLTINLALAYSQSGRLEEGRKVLKQFIERPGLRAMEQERAQAILREFEK